MGYLIDTSIFVAWERGQVQASDLLAASSDQPVALSSITASDLLHGVERADGAQRRARRAAFVETILTAIDVLPVDLDVARVHARIWADLRARGQTIGAHDMLIAATALHHEMRIATRNPRDFERIEELSVEVW